MNIQPEGAEEVGVKCGTEVWSTNIQPQPKSTRTNLDPLPHPPFSVSLLTNLLPTKQTKSPSLLTKSSFDPHKAMVKRKFDDEEEIEAIAVGIFRTNTLFESVIDSLNSIATSPQASSDSHHWILDSGPDGRRNG